MLESLKANILFHQLLKRPNIEKAYKMVPPTDAWYDTITSVHNSLAEIQVLSHKVLEITSHDGLTMRGVYYPGESSTTVIWAHGYTSHAERESAFPGLFYHSLGYNVLIPYQRAHHISQGKYISFGALEHLDMMQWVQKVNSITPNGNIVLHGLSMGGGIVLDMADKEMQNVKCIIADAPSTSIQDVFKNVSQSIFKSGYEKIYAYVLERYKKVFGVDAADYETIQFVKNSRYPIFLTAGSQENMEEQLSALQAANPMETEILILPGCNHGNGMYKQTELYQDALKNFITRHVGDCHARVRTGAQ